MANVQQPMADFGTTVQTMFGHWLALTYAVDQAAGGPNSAAKLAWLVDVVGDYVPTARHDDDVADFLGQILDNEFSLVIEDGSLEMMGRLLRTAWTLHCQGDRRGLTDVVQRLQAAHDRNPTVAATSSSTSGDESSATDGPEEEESMETDQRETPKAKPLVDDDGWQLVTPKNRKQKS